MGELEFKSFFVLVSLTAVSFWKGFSFIVFQILVRILQGCLWVFEINYENSLAFEITPSVLQTFFLQIP